MAGLGGAATLGGGETAVGTAGAVGTAKIAANYARGDQFQNAVQDFVELEENFDYVVGEVKGSYMASRPDLLSPTNITEIKDMLRVVFSRQLQIQSNAATMSGVPWSIIVSPRILSITKPTIDAVIASGGFVVKFDAAMNVFVEIYDPVSRAFGWQGSSIPAK